MAENKSDLEEQRLDEILRVIPPTLADELRSIFDAQDKEIAALRNDLDTVNITKDIERAAQMKAEIERLRGDLDEMQKKLREKTEDSQGGV